MDLTKVQGIVESVVSAHGASLYDLEFEGGTLRLWAEPSADGGIDDLATISRALSRTLDAEDPIPGTYLLEVSSPGLERRLRTEAHFDGAVGEDVNVKTRPDVGGDRRIKGRLERVRDGHIVIRSSEDGAEHSVPIDAVERAVTVFEWGKAEKPGPTKGRPKAAGRTNVAATSDSTTEN